MASITQGPLNFQLSALIRDHAPGTPEDIVQRIQYHVREAADCVCTTRGAARGSP